MSEPIKTETLPLSNRFKPYPEYKDPGVKWLEEVPIHWEVKRIKWITVTHKQGYYTEDLYVDEGVKLARITDIDDFGAVSFEEMPFVDISAKDESIFNLKDNDFLFARSGTIGRFGIVRNPQRSVFASYLIRFRFKECLPEFLRFAFGSHFFKECLISTLHGGANQNVHAENIKEQLLPIPPSREQLAIVQFLDPETAKIDALISEKEQLIELLQEKRSALISQAVTKGLDPNVPMKDSGAEWLGEIPAHWKLFPFKYLFCVIYRYPTYYGIDYVADGVTEIRGEALGADGEILQLDDQRYISSQLSEQFPRTILECGDLIMSVRGTMGKVGIVDDKFAGSNITANLIRLSPRQNIVSGRFLVYAFMSRYFEQQLDRQSPQTTIKTITVPQLSAISIPIPSLPEEQSKIVTYIKEETYKIDVLTAKVREGIESLKEYRTALISAAVTGKIDVRGEVVQ